MTWKVTPSLYSSWRHYALPKFDRTEEQEAEARAEFIRVLRKEKTDVTPEMERGNQFESLIMKYVFIAKAKSENRGCLALERDTSLLNKGDIVCAQTIGEQVYNGEFQVKDGRELPSGNYIYGVADCILLNGIIDFKRVTQYEQDKYKDSIQHWAYMYIWDLPQFYYYVGAGDPEPYIEPYCWFKGAEGLLDSRIAEMIGWINADAELRDIFAEFWTYEKE